jgi:hypothetical protein
MEAMTSKINQLGVQLRTLTERAMKLELQIRNKQAEIACELCPHPVGTQIVSTYSVAGKVQVYELSRITADPMDSRRYRMYGKRVNKNGVVAPKEVPLNTDAVWEKYVAPKPEAKAKPEAKSKLTKTEQAKINRAKKLAEKAKATEAKPVADTSAKKPVAKTGGPLRGKKVTKKIATPAAKAAA